MQCEACSDPLTPLPPMAFDHMTVDLDLNNFWVLQARWLRKITSFIIRIAYSLRPHTEVTFPQIFPLLPPFL